MKRNLIALLAAAAALTVGAARAQATDIVDEWASVKAPAPPVLKPVTVDPKTTALLMLDFLPSFYCSDDPRCVATLPAMKKLLTEARSHGAPVIYSLAGKFSQSDIAKDVAPVGSEPTVKSHADKFLDTDLEKILKDKGIQSVIVTGTAANGAVLYTGSGAALRGYKVIIPIDGLSAKDLYAEQLTAWQLAHGPGFGKQVTLTKSDMIKF
ncbi:MAG: cysteine hydrolase family protein [Pseudolabrys sp.]